MGCCPIGPVPRASSTFSSSISSPLVTSSNLSSQSPTDLNKWMKRLPDNVEVSQLSIPGTHNSGTYSCGFFDFRRITQCQVMNIAQQLEAGIRFLDIRIVPVKQQLYMCHGPIKLEKLEVLFTEVARFLHFNPSQFVMMSFISTKLRRDYPEILTKMLEEYSIDSMFTKDIPTVKQLRGKAWILKGFFVDFQNTFTLDGPPQLNRLYLQNHCEITQQFSIHHKCQKVFQTAFQISHRHPKNDQTRLKINFLSVGGRDHWTGIFTGPYPCDNAFHPQGPNAKLYSELQKRGKVNLGVTVMDFPGVQLIEKIIYTNKFVEQ